MPGLPPSVPTRGTRRPSPVDEELYVQLHVTRDRLADEGPPAQPEQPPAQHLPADETNRHALFILVLLVALGALLAAYVYRADLARLFSL